MPLDNVTDPRLLAVQRATQNMAPDQAMQYIQKVADSGTVPGSLAYLMGLYQKVKALQGMQPTQPGQAAQPTVREQMEAQLNQGVASIPAPAFEREDSFAGGGIVAFNDGGEVARYDIGGPIYVDSAGRAAANMLVPRANIVPYKGPDGDDFERLKKLFDAADPAEQSRILQWADKKMPTFSKWARTSGRFAAPVIKRAPLVGTGFSLNDAAHADPESIQETSRLAQLGLMDVDPSSGFKTGLATLTGVAESSIPVAGLFYKTPLEKARAQTDKKIKEIGRGGIETTLSPEEKEIARQYQELVAKYGSNSKEVKAFEEGYRSRFATSPESADYETGLPALLDGGRGRQTLRASQYSAPEINIPRGERPDMAALEKEQDEFYKRTGTGQYSKALADQEKLVEAEQAQLDKNRERSKADFWIQMGASMLGSRSPSFAQALGDSIKENYGNLVKDIKDLQKERRGLEAMKIDLRRTQEQAMETGRKDLQTRYDRQLERYENRELKVIEIEIEAKNKVLDRQLQVDTANLAYSNRQDTADKLWKLWEWTREPGLEPRARAARQQTLIEAREAALANMRASVPGAYSADQSAAARREQARLRAIDQMGPRFQFASPEEQDDMIERQLRIMDMATGTNRYEGFSATPVE